MSTSSSTDTSCTRCTMAGACLHLLRPAGLPVADRKLTCHGLVRALLAIREAAERHQQLADSFRATLDLLRSPSRDDTERCAQAELRARRAAGILAQAEAIAEAAKHDADASHRMHDVSVLTMLEQHVVALGLAS